MLFFLAVCVLVVYVYSDLFVFISLPLSSGDPYEAHLSTNMARFHHIFTSAAATGEYERVAQGGCGHMDGCHDNTQLYTLYIIIVMTVSASILGLFENYLTVKFRDPNLEAVSFALFHIYIIIISIIL